MVVSEREREAMRRAFTLASRGPRGINPQVGAVALSPTGEVIAEGWHRGAGSPHAEIEALRAANGRVEGATMVVTLEPCNHTGRTGPCAEALIDAGVRRVVYSVTDPGVESRGGAERLRAAGVDVEGDVLVEEGTALLESWLRVQRLGRPHVTVKWAQSLDGRAAAPDGTSTWITGPAARADVHRRRAEADAIVVGTGTVLRDDPALTARDAQGALLPHQPVPVVLGTREVPESAALRRHPHPYLQVPTHNLFGESGPVKNSVLAHLRENGIQTVFVEGGPTVASAFVRAGLADRLLTYIAPTLIGSADNADRPAIADIGVTTIGAQRRLMIDTIERLGDDLLVVSHPEEEA